LTQSFLLSLKYSFKSAWNLRIDIMTSVSGLDFVPTWERRTIVDFGGETAPVLCRADVLKSKIAAGRVQDRRDARNLMRRDS
jgi:hypothetical protein